MEKTKKKVVSLKRRMINSTDGSPYHTRSKARKIADSEHNENLAFPSTSSVISSESWDQSIDIKKYTARKVTGVQGRKFEVLTVARLLLHLTLDDEVNDFELSTENTDYWRFDDVVLEIKSDGKEEKYAIQLKYAESENTSLELNPLFGDKKNIATLLKKHKGFKMIAVTNIPGKKRKMKCKGSTVQIQKESPESTKFFNKLYQHKDSCYEFISVRSEEDTFWKYCLLYTNQINNEEIVKDIKTMFEKFVDKEENPKKEKLEKSVGIYTNFIEVWNSRSGEKAVLTKKVMKDVIAWCLLVPYVKFWSFTLSKPVSEEGKTFRESCKGEPTHLNIKNFDKMKNLWADVPFEPNTLKEKLYHYEIMCPKQNCYESTEEQRTKELWLMNELPLCVKNNKTTAKIRKGLCKERKFVLLDKNENSGSSFKKLSDLKRYNKNIYNQVLETFRCKIQGKEEIFLKTLIQENEEICNLISTNELVDMSDKPLMIGEKEEELVCYIEISLTYNVAEDNFLRTEVKEFLGQINLICADPGMGKSTLLKHMKNKSSPSSWVILICARDHSLHYEKKGDDINEFKQYILTYMSKKHNYTKFEEQLLDIFLREGRIFYYWDGLDELSETDLRVVKNIIKKLAEEKGCQQWLTSRNNLKKDLENEFNVISRTIKQFDEDDQKKYIMERLKSSEKYTENDFSAIYDKIQASIQSCSRKDILAIPLHIYLIVELVIRDQDKFGAFLEGIFLMPDLCKNLVDGMGQLAVANSPLPSCRSQFTSETTPRGDNSPPEQLAVRATCRRNNNWLPRQLTAGSNVRSL